MILRQRMPQDVREKVNNYIKNREDISQLIKPYLLENEYLSGAIISEIDRLNENLRNVNFSRCEIGQEGKITNFSGSNLMGSNFQGCTFKGKVWFNHADLRNCNFNDAFMPYVEYKYADLRNITICNAFIRMGSRSGYKARFEKKQFDLLARYLQLDVI